MGLFPLYFGFFFWVVLFFWTGFLFGDFVFWCLGVLAGFYNFLLRLKSFYYDFFRFFGGDCLSRYGYGSSTSRSSDCSDDLLFCFGSRQRYSAITVTAILAPLHLVSLALWSWIPFVWWLLAVALLGCYGLWVCLGFSGFWAARDELERPQRINKIQKNK